MIVTLKLAREYAQLWAEYETLQLQTNKLHHNDIRFQILADMKMVIGDRLNDINQQIATAYRQNQKKK
jgi:hypothetical protein